MLELCSGSSYFGRKILRNLLWPTAYQFVPGNSKNKFYLWIDKSNCWIVRPMATNISLKFT